MTLEADVGALDEVSRAQAPVAPALAAPVPWDFTRPIAGALDNMLTKRNESSTVAGVRGGMIGMTAIALVLASCKSDPEPAREPLLAAEKLLPWTGGPLLDSLRGGGYILYFRHFHTDHSRWHEDPIKPKHGEMTVADFLATCDQQRPLTRFGRRRAKEIGYFIRKLGIPVGQVLSSPYCRAVESATLLAGRPPDSTLYDLLHPGGTLTREMMSRNVRPHLGQIPPAGTNTIIVAHRPQMDDVRFIEEGECFVIQPLGHGRFNVVATIYDSDWYEAELSIDYLGLRGRQPGSDAPPRGVTK